MFVGSIYDVWEMHGHMCISTCGSLRLMPGTEASLVSLSPYVLVMVPIVVKRHHDQSSSYKEKHLIEMTAYSFRGFVLCCHGGEHGGWEYVDMQANMVLEISTS